MTLTHYKLSNLQFPKKISQNGVSRGEEELVFLRKVHCVKIVSLFELVLRNSDIKHIFLQMWYIVINILHCSYSEIYWTWVLYLSWNKSIVINIVFSKFIFPLWNDLWNYGPQKQTIGIINGTYISLRYKLCLNLILCGAWLKSVQITFALELSWNPVYCQHQEISREMQWWQVSCLGTHLSAPQLNQSHKISQNWGKVLSLWPPTCAL